MRGKEIVPCSYIDIVESHRLVETLRTIGTHTVSLMARILHSYLDREWNLILGS